MTTLYNYCKQNGKEYLLQEWDYELNRDINPHTVRTYSHTKCWWKCFKCGYKWETKVVNRTRQHTGCPACAGSILLVGKNDLATKYPDVAKEWHPTKNGLLKPENFYAVSEYKAWWLCPTCGHEWETTIKQRTGKKLHKCPQCSHQTVVGGKNDLATTHPHIAAEWHPIKNGDVIYSFI